MVCSLIFQVLFTFAFTFAYLNMESILQIQQHLDRMVSLVKNPPVNLADLGDKFLREYGSDLQELRFLSDAKSRQLYINQANNNNSHPGYEMMVDISCIGHLTAHSGVTFTSFV